jgi:hypothetical protein
LYQALLLMVRCKAAQKQPNQQGMNTLFLYQQKLLLVPPSRPPPPRPRPMLLVVVMVVT